jgi:hypothetical protein
MRRLRLGKYMNTFRIITSFLFRSAHARQAAIVYAIAFLLAHRGEAWWSATVVMPEMTFV